jgi:DNA modification methylase
MKAEPPFHTLSLADLRIPPNRQRAEFDPKALAELVESIREKGLFHAPVVRESTEGFLLVAGGRRLHALRALWEAGESVSYSGVVLTPYAVPFTTLGELSLLEAEEAELDENLQRRDLTWQEHAAATRRLHLLRQAQAEAQRPVGGGIPAPNSPPGPGHTVADTALEVRGSTSGSAHEATRREIIVARHLNEPEIAGARTVDDAFRKLKETESKLAAAEVAAASPSGSHTLISGDCLTWMKNPSHAERFDAILTDPPEGRGAQGDTPESWSLLLHQWATLSYQVTKPQSHAYIFCDIEKFPSLKEMMQAAGWYVFRTPLISHRLDSGPIPLPDSGPRRQWESILYAIKGKKPVTHIYPDVIPNRLEEGMQQEAQKSIALCSNLLLRSVRPGDFVLDSFCGTGTIFPAAHPHRVWATGIELSPKQHALALNRLESL